MLAKHSTHPSTARLPLDSRSIKTTKDIYTTKPSNYTHKQLPKLKTGMPPHERLPGVHQLLTPVSPPAYGRTGIQRSGDLSYRPTQPRSSLPLEDILCSDTPRASASRSYATPPPLTHSGSSGASSFYSPASQYTTLSRDPRTYHPHNSSLPGLSDYYGYHPDHSTRPSSAETRESSRSSSSITPSIPPPTQARLIGAQDFPGEGKCWVYDDGTHIRQEIDGEAVNPQWGVTKAGKPRKRLAQACLTCREKKIKCDLADPKCLQCDKSGRECRYASARASRRPGS